MHTTRYFYVLHDINVVYIIEVKVNSEEMFIGDIQLQALKIFS